MPTTFSNNLTIKIEGTDCFAYITCNTHRYNWEDISCICKSAKKKRCLGVFQRKLCDKIQRRWCGIITLFSTNLSIFKILKCIESTVKFFIL